MCLLVYVSMYIHIYGGVECMHTDVGLVDLPEGVKDVVTHSSGAWLVDIRWRGECL